MARRRSVKTPVPYTARKAEAKSELASAACTLSRSLGAIPGTSAAIAALADRHVRLLADDPENVEALIAIRRLLDSFLRDAEGLPGFDTEVALLDLDPAADVSPRAQLAATISTAVRMTTPPWHNDVTRRTNIICGPDGYPLRTPRLRKFEVLGRLKDELELIPISISLFRIADLDGDLHELPGPKAKASGLVDMTIFRAWRGLSLSTLNKLRERLPEPADRRIGIRFGPEWPHPTKLAGYRPGRDGIDIRVYLQAEHFGVAPDSEDDLEDPEDTAFPEPPAGES